MKNCEFMIQRVDSSKIYRFVCFLDNGLSHVPISNLIMVISISKQYFTFCCKCICNLTNTPQEPYDPFLNRSCDLEVRILTKEKSKGR